VNTLRHGGVRASRLIGFAATLLLGTLAIGLAEPAAGSVNTTLRPVGWAYTDSRQPNSSYMDGQNDARIGSWRDDEAKHHKSRSYFSYDISSFRGQAVVSATLFVAETSVTDCSRPRNWQLWYTSPIAAGISWSQPPMELSKVGDIGGVTCPSSEVQIDVGAAVARALADRQSTLTLELRVPQEAEGNLHLGRSVRHDPALSLRSDTPPNLPTDVTIDAKPCGGTQPLWISTETPYVSARITDPDQSGIEAQPITATFAVWPLARPQSRLEWTTREDYAPVTVAIPLPAGLLAEGELFGLTVRTTDDQTSSAWTSECLFKVDTHRPTSPPLITPTASPLEFVLSTNGVEDIVGYRYGLSMPSTFVAAPALGAPATVSITPVFGGPATLYAYSVDRAGNVSDVASRTFVVPDTAPRIQDLDPDAFAGDPHRLNLSPRMDGVVSYGYRVDDGPEQTIAADAGGTAQISVTPQPTGSTVYVFSMTAAGTQTRQGFVSLVPDTRPVVSSAQFPSLGTGAPVGMPGTFVITPHMHDVAEYVYQFNRGLVDEQPPQTAAAGSEAGISVTFTPTRAGTNTLSVLSRTADGSVSQERVYTFHPISIAPDVFSDEYPGGEFAGGIGIAGTFLFVPTASQVVEYVYQFGAEPEQTVTADQDGVAFVEWTPQAAGYVQLIVRSRSADGTLSDPRTYLVAVAE
jgi:hypothetical protein